MFLTSVRNVEESYDIPGYKSSAKVTMPLNLSLCTLKINFHHNYKWSFPQERLKPFLHRRIQQMFGK